MDATQMISDSIMESEEEESEEENERGRPLAKLCIFKNAHIPETELPLFLGDNVLGRDPNTCTLPLSAPSISKQHATICISVYRKRGSRNEVDTEALVWDLGSMNGTRKGRLKLTPNVRYALGERDSLVVADIPCRYVSCAGDAFFSQRDARTPVSGNSGARSPDASGEKGNDTSGEKSVNGGTTPGVSLPDQEDTRKTPVRTSGLSFEQTPAQPQGSLVPESDSDSDGERGNRRRKALVSDSDSHKSSPDCSAFLSPTNKIVPESEDESPITPSSSAKNRPCRHVSFSKDEVGTDVGRQQPKSKETPAIVDDSEEEEGRAAPGGRKAEESGQHVPAKQESDVSPRGEVELPVSTPPVFTNPIPAFDMDSDTGEEEGLTSVTSNTNQLVANQLPNTAQFHMDSDTDIDEEDDAFHKVPKSADHIKPPHVVQPEGITMDSDTDVDDDDDDAAIKAKPTYLQSTRQADSSSTRLNDLHLDSETDVDDEEEKECGADNACSKIDESATRSDIEPESSPAAPHGLHLGSDTDDEAPPAPAISEPSVVSAVTQLIPTADAAVDAGVPSDSDTDVENDSPLVKSAAASASSGAPRSDSDADTDVDEPGVPPAGDTVNPPDLGGDSDTDVEDEVDRENTPGLLVPLQQNCSTPVQASGELEDMETQSFLSPSSSGPFRRAQAPAGGAIASSSCSDSQEDDLTVAETQSFVLQTRECRGNPPDHHTVDPNQSSGDEKGEQSIRGRSFQLGLSDCSHLEGQAQALAMESTQAFVSVAGGLNLEDTQAYATISTADGASLENDLDLEACGEDKKPARCSVMSAEGGLVDFALEATQAYISEPCSDSEDETDEDERKNNATAETQPFDFPTPSTVAIAETQPVCAFEEESSDEEKVTPRPQNVTVKRQKRRPSEALSVAETQPMCVSEDEGSDDEDVIPAPRKRKAKPLQLEEEQTQTLSNSELSAGETQPTDAGEDGESDEEDLFPGPRKRRAKPRQLEDETQPLTSSGVLETQESDEEDSVPGPRKRKAKALRLEEEESQPMVAGEDRESDEEDSIPGPRKRKAKPQQIQEEETQPPSTAESQLTETKPCLQPPRRKGRQSEAATSGAAIRGRRETRARIREGREEQEKLGRERKEDEEQERVQAENAETLRLEHERAEKERIERETMEQEEKERVDRARKEREEQLERERKEAEEKERSEREKAEREEKERIEKERKEKEEEERLEREKAEREEKERIEKERKEKEEEERLERQKAEREEKERIEKERKEKEEEKERLERERDEREHQIRLEREAKEREEGERLEEAKQEKDAKEKQELKEEENKSKTPARGRRGTRRTITTEPEPDSVNDDVPARRTRSRSNSSNSISSERSAASVTSQRSRGRGRGAKRTSGPQHGGHDISPQGVLSRSNSANSEISSCSLSSQTRGRGGRQRGRGRKSEAEPDSIPTTSSQRGQSLAPKPAARGRKSRKVEESSHEIPHEDDVEKADSQQASTTRGRRRADANGSQPADIDKKEPSSQERGSEESPLPKRTVRGKGQKAVKSETVEAPVAPSVSDGDECKEKRRGRKRELDEDASSSSNISNEKEKAQRTEEAEEETNGGTKDEIPVQAKRRGRASSAQAKKNTKDPPAELEVKEESEKAEEGTVERRGRGRPSVVPRKKKEEQQEGGTSVDPDPHVEASEPLTPTGGASRKRQARPDSSRVLKTPCPSPASPTASGRRRASGQAYKVLFTGVVDEEGERVLARLGGGQAKGVADMNCLVTDKVRRTVKFLCAVAKGVPIVNTHWLGKSGKAGSFLSPHAFIVKDPEQEKKFSFCLQESLTMARSQPLLQGYEIHVTKSVKPEPVHMKDIISCSGATFLAKMPSSQKPQTVVISCEDDLSLCRPALAASLPVVTAEFILTGILRQKLDLQTHALSAPANTPQPAGGRGRSRKKT